MQLISTIKNYYTINPVERHLVSLFLIFDLFARLNAQFPAA